MNEETLRDLRTWTNHRIAECRLQQKRCDPDQMKLRAQFTRIKLHLGNLKAMLEMEGND